MRVSSNDLSDAARRMELDREKDFFRLLYVAEKSFEGGALQMNDVDWRLACDCLDQKNYRYADFWFLLGFTSTYVLRNRTGRSILSRLRFPFYMGLVGYDCGLRMTPSAPALRFWNSICMVDSEFGRIARELHTPDCFYEAAADVQPLSTTPSSSVPFFTWVTEDIHFVAQSLLLRKVWSNLFEGSVWNPRSTDGSAAVSLVISNRFFRWKPIEIRRPRSDGVIVTEIFFQYLPQWYPTRAMTRSYHCRHLIIDRSTLGGRLWYNTSFLLLGLFGVKPSTGHKL